MMHETMSLKKCHLITPKIIHFFLSICFNQNIHRNFHWFYFIQEHTSPLWTNFVQWISMILVALDSCLCSMLIVLVKRRWLFFPSIVLAARFFYWRHFSCASTLVRKQDLNFVSRPVLNRLTPNDPYMGRTAPLTSKRCSLYIYSKNIGTEYFKHALYSPFFSILCLTRDFIRQGHAREKRKVYRATRTRSQAIDRE